MWKDTVTKEMMVAVRRAWAQDLTVNQRLVMRRVGLEGKPIKDVADEMGVSVDRVLQIQEAASIKLKRVIVGAQRETRLRAMFSPRGIT